MFCIILLVLFILFIPFNMAKINENIAKIDSLQQNTHDLQKQISSLNVLSSSTQNLKDVAAFLNTLIPDSEDYFSIIYTLDNLSRETGFTIVGYSIDLSRLTKGQLQLVITGVGSRDSFLKFLKDYNYNGGRFITSDKIELSQQTAGQFKVNTTFYSQKLNPSTINTITLSPVSLQQLTDLQQKVTFALKESNTATAEGTTDFTYARKTNPF